MFQFSLRNLLVAVAVVAVATAALLNSNEWWASLLWGAALSMLVFAGLVALFRREAQRAFWSGYMVAGSFYLLLLVFADASLPLITKKVIVWGYSLLPDSKKSQYMPPPAPPAGGIGGTGSVGMSAAMMPGMPGGGGMGMPGMGGMGMGPSMTLNPSYIEQNGFMQVGHALWMLILSWLGGTVALGLFRTRDKSHT